MYGYGHGSHFVAFLGPSHCQHCNNTKPQLLNASYSSEMLMGVTEYTYGGVSIVCPVCKYGFSFEFPPFNSRMSKWFGGKKTKEKWDDARRKLAALERSIDIELTKRVYVELGFFEKRRYQKMLDQLKFGNLLIQLKHA